MSYEIQSPYTRDACSIDASVQSSSPGIGQGDFLYWTGVGVASLGSSTHSAAFCGVAMDPWPSAYIAPNADTSSTMPFARAGVFAFAMTAGQTYTPGAKLYVGANAQTVSTVVAGTSIGYVAYSQPLTLSRQGLVAVVIVPVV